MPAQIRVRRLDATEHFRRATVAGLSTLSKGSRLGDRQPPYSFDGGCALPTNRFCPYGPDAVVFSIRFATPDHRLSPNAGDSPARSDGLFFRGHGLTTPPGLGPLPLCAADPAVKDTDQ